MPVSSAALEKFQRDLNSLRTIVDELSVCLDFLDVLRILDLICFFFYFLRLLRLECICTRPYVD